VAHGQSNPLRESYYPNVKGQEAFTSQIEAVLPQGARDRASARAAAMLGRE
jgi:hypothetical protein